MSFRLSFKLSCPSAARRSAPRRASLWRAGVGAALLSLSAGFSVATAAPLDCPAAPLDTAPALQIEPAAAAAASAAPDRGFLWRIRKDGRDAYLYGTLHVGQPDWRTPGPRVAQALAASDTLALELDPLDADVLRRLERGVAARPERTLAPALTQRIERLARAECLPARALSGLIPEIQIAALMSLLARREGLDSAYGIDMLLARWGHAEAKTVVSLETPELQLRVMQNLPASASAPVASRAELARRRAELQRSVASTLDAIEAGRARVLLARIAQVWSTGDLAGLLAYADWCECMDTPAQRAEMARTLDARNPALADAIAALHRRGQHVFAAVGSLHLIGPLGLPALLAQRGFQVERLSAKAP